MLLLLRKAGVVLTLTAPVVFLLIWNHLFAIDVSSARTESDSGLSTQKTFTVR